MASSSFLQPLWKKLLLLPAASSTYSFQRGNAGMYAFISSSSVSSSSFCDFGFEEWLSRHRKSYNTPEEKERLFRSFQRKQMALQKKKAFWEKKKALREKFAAYPKMQGYVITIREGEDDEEEEEESQVN